MENQTKNSGTAMSELMVKQVVNAWEAQNKSVTAFFNKYDDAVYSNEIAQGRNRAIYILGHLTAVSDAMLPLLGVGEKLYPQLAEVFFAPDKSVQTIPSIAELKKQWEAVNTTLSKHFNKMNANDWMGKHTSVTAEDFAKEPHRNKLNVLISRTNHQSYHLGQLNLLKADSK